MRRQRALTQAFLVAVVLSVPSADAKPLRCDSDDGGIHVPKGLCALVVADRLGRGRHLAVNRNGDVYLRLRKSSPEGSIVALRDSDGDGKADVVRQFGDDGGGTGIEIRNGFLYAATNIEILRWRLDPKELVPKGSPETIARAL